MPIGEYAGGHLYQVGGYGTVYIVSLFICTCGLVYVLTVLRNEPGDDTPKDKKLNEEDFHVVIEKEVRTEQKESQEAWTHDQPKRIKADFLAKLGVIGRY